jgi:hypothetical protein
MQSAKLAEEADQKKMRGLLMQQQERTLGQQNQMDALARSSFAPPQTAPNDPYEAHQTPGGGGLPAFAQGMAQIDPMKALQLQSQIAQMNAKERVKVGPGETLGSYQGEKFVPHFTAPDKAPAGFTNGPNGLNVDPNWFEAQKALREAGRPSVSVNTALEKREQGDKGALNVKNFGELQGGAASARKENAILSAMEKNPVDTSRAAPLTSTAAAWLSAAGMGGDRVKQVASNSQMFQAAAMELVLQKQLAQKGPQTESDAKRLEQTVASLGNTKDANAAIIAFSKAANNRTIAQEKFYNDWWRKNQTYEGADVAWLNGPGGRSIFDDPEMKKYGNGGWSATRIGN